MARCEHDAVMAGANNEMMFLNIKALNEWDSKVSELKQISMTLILTRKHGETTYDHTACTISRAAVEAFFYRFNICIIF